LVTIQDINPLSGAPRGAPDPGVEAMARLTVEHDRSLYYEDHGGTRLPVLLIHGWGMSCRVWDTVNAALQDAGHRVICFDQRGCGSSDKDFDDVSVATAAQDIVRLVDQLGLPQVVLNGWSLGGALAVEAASRLGGRCAGLVLTGAATPRYVQTDGFPHGGAPGSVAQTVAALRSNRTPFLHGLAQAVCARDPGDGVVQWLWLIFQQSSPAADAALAELDELDQRELLAGLTVPTLAFVGSADGFVDPAVGRAAAATLKARLVELEGCGHAPFLEEGERYRRELLSFVESLE
jgi:pimeloyl-[acyl-carrier protein] methyl ester esterase